MKAVQINAYGDNSVLTHAEVDKPSPSANQVLVQLKASSVNPVDYKIRSGFFAGQMTKQFPFTLGWEGAGVIAETGSEVSELHVGDAVMVMPNFMQGGTYAEFVAVNAEEVIKKPETLDFELASVIPFSLGTAYAALIEDADIQAGQSILIHGAGGAVGQMAVQIAKNKGLHVIGTASGENVQELRELGIDEVIDYAATDFASVLHDLDVVLDLVGGETQAKSYPLLTKGGMLVSTTQPPSPTELEKYGLSGKMTVTHFDAQKFEVLAQWIDAGQIQIKRPEVYPLSDAIEALARVENRKAKSKIVFSF